MSQSGNHEARAKALALLTGRDYTERKLREKLLQKGFDEEACDDAVSYVKNYGYINDEKYAARYIELHKNSMSRLRISADLKEKRGVPADLAEETLRKAGEWDEKPLIRRLALGKLSGKNVRDPEVLKKVTGFLARKGFRYSDIRQVMREFSEDENGLDEPDWQDAFS